MTADSLKTVSKQTPTEQEYQGIAVSSIVGVVEKVAKLGFHCQIEGYHHAFSDRAMREAKLYVERLCAEMLTLNPNPPKDTDGRREDSGRGWVRELQGRWPGVLG